MHERETLRVQRLARERGEERRQLRGPSTAVHGIADQRVADRRHVHANLVRASGLEPAGDQRDDAVPLQHLDVRARSYYWVDRSGPDQPSATTPVRANEVARNDGAARRSWLSVLKTAPGSETARIAQSYLDQLGPDPAPSGR